METEILTFQEVRRFLKVSNSTLYRLAQSKKIPALKIGRTWRFRKEKLISWLDKQEKYRE
ncbi:MAG: helix-turn-helix domain-containing protein [Candidatus Omnitrophica bacterium]|nr:helix-turn-helix domain-containing protein [Candidatus Omnitrophota bacterium]